MELGGLPPTNVGVVGCHRGDPRFVPRTSVFASTSQQSAFMSCIGYDTLVGEAKDVGPPHRR